MPGATVGARSDAEGCVDHDVVADVVARMLDASLETLGMLDGAGLGVQRGALAMLMADAVLLARLIDGWTAGDFAEIVGRLWMYGL